MKEYTARGAVSRRQFGALSIGAGNEKQAERAWSRLLVLFGKALA